MQKRTIALAGNPNVGKSTVFNALTGLRQHTGNWPGKTVETAQGVSRCCGATITWIDLPGCYSLTPRSGEEAVARDALLFGQMDAAIIVCDAGCLSRNLNLALQVLELVPHAVLCINLMDEARRRGLHINCTLLSKRLGVPVVACSARSGEGLRALQHAALQAVSRPPHGYRVRYPQALEHAIAQVEAAIAPALSPGDPPARYLALRLLEGDTDLLALLRSELHVDLCEIAAQALASARAALARDGLTSDVLSDRIVESLFSASEQLCAGVTVWEHGAQGPERWQLQLDRLLTNRYLCAPILAALLAVVFYLTLSGANLPSEWLAALFARAEAWLAATLKTLGAPQWLRGALVDGAVRTTAWVVSVMLPPMAIFFPLFSLLEEAGFLPRMAFSLDGCFRRCGACGKQGLTMCMGLGCNAVGVTGCRIIDSPRERLIAIVTNALIPCNGRFPTLIVLSALLFAGGGSGVSALVLTGLLLLSLGVTLGVSKLLAATLLHGKASSFVLELPPYRRPQLGRVLVRSLLDRTLFVLGRAVAVAAPAGVLLWALTYFSPGGVSLLARLVRALDPIGRFLGMDGSLLSAFLLSFPANEMTLSIALSAYFDTGVSSALPALASLRPALAACGWTARTALCAMLFCLFHWPCSTTCLTIRKETGSFAWAAVSVVLCTAVGVVLCAAVNFLWTLFA